MNELTKEQIEQAKEVSFSNLLILNRQNFARCPFHNERTPSLHIRDNRAYCFGCGWKGDTIQFVREYYELSFELAIEYLLNGRIYVHENN